MMLSTSVLLVLFVGCCQMVTCQNWTYTHEAVTYQGQPCFTDCVNGFCYVDMDSSPIPCISTDIVAPKYRTKTGAYCVSNCGYFGKQYEFCATALDTRQVDYCNSGDDDQLSAYGGKCTNKCEPNSQGFYWCDVGHSWHYCSPPKEERKDEVAVEDVPDWTYTNVGLSLEGKECFSGCLDGKCYLNMDTPLVDCYSLNIPVPNFRTMRGAKCVSNCGYFGQQYEICATTKNTKKTEYCNSSFDSSLSVHGEQCSSKCELSDKGFYWCKVGNSWQFCAPPATFDNEKSELSNEIPHYSVVS